MNKYLLVISFFIAASFAFFSTPASAQSDAKTPSIKPNISLDKKQKKQKNQIKVQKNNDLSFEQSKAGEAAKYLDEIENSLLKLKIYKLEGTDKSVVEPRIADSIITSGKDAAKFQKIAAKVLGYHKLTDVCSAVLFDDKNPTVFTYRLRSISFSSGIFDVLSDDEIAALIAHEVGHIYLGKELAQARDAGDARLARIIELKCDAIALITLKNLKINPAVLIKALKKLIEAREKLGFETASEQSASMEDRTKLTKYFLKKFN